VKYDNASQLFYSYSVSGFAKSNTVMIIFIVIALVLALSIVFIVIYFIWIRNVIATRRKARAAIEMARKAGGE
jgi:flagellar biosynthesis/type III secretory pathway M-ring protein FliF/YscJ